MQPRRRTLRQLPPNLRNINPHLIRTPRRRSPMLSQQPHRPPLQPTLPMHRIHSPGILVHGMLRPLANRAFIQLLVDLGEARCGDGVAHRELGVQRAAGVRGAVEEGLPPACEEGVGLEGAVVGHDAHVELDLFYPAAGLEVTTWG